MVCRLRLAWAACSTATEPPPLLGPAHSQPWTRRTEVLMAVDRREPWACHRRHGDATVEQKVVSVQLKCLLLIIDGELLRKKIIGSGMDEHPEIKLILNYRGC